MRKGLLYILFFLSLTQSIHSQKKGDGVASFDIPVKNSLKFNKFIINPAFSYAREDESFITVLNRRQWTGFENAPQTYFFSYSGRFRDDNSLAVGLFQQNYGILTTFGVVGNFARNVSISNDSNLTFGFNLGYINSGLNDGKIITNDLSDTSLQNIPKNSSITINPGINYGVGYMDFGLSLNNMLFYNVNNSGMVSDDPAKGVEAHIMYTGYIYRDGFLENSKFSTLLKGEIRKDKTVFTGSVLFNVPKGLWAQAGYNSVYGISGGAGVTIAKKISLGYTLEKGMGNFSGFGMTHEITLAYKLKGYGDFEDYKPIVKATKKTNPNIKRAVVKKKSPAELKKERDAQLAIKAKNDSINKANTAAALAQRIQEAKDKAEAERLRIEAEKARLAKEAAEAKAKAEAAARAKAEADRLLALQGKDKATLEAERLRKEKLAAEAKAKAEEAARIKAEAEAARLRREKEAADAKAKLDAEARAKAEADKLKAAQTEAERLRLVKEAADAKAKADAEAKAKLDAEKAKAEAERLRLAKEAADAKAKADAEAKAKLDAEKAKAEAERLRLAKEAADAKAKADAEAKAKLEADKLKAAQTEAERLRLAKEAADAKAKADAEAKAKLEEEKAKAEAERLRLAKEAADAKAKADAEAKAKLDAEKARLAQESADAKAKADAEAKAKLDAEKARLAKEAADAKAKTDAEAKAKLDAEKEKAEAEKARLAKEAADAKAKADAEAERLRLEEEAKAKLNAAKTAEDKQLDYLSQVIDDSKKNQSQSLSRLDSIANAKESELKELKRVNDLSEQGVVTEAKEFQSSSAANRALESLKSEIAENNRNQNNFIKEFETLYNDRLKKVPNKNDVVNQNYLKTIEKLKLEKSISDKRNTDLLAKLERIKTETDIEKKRRIKRADFESNQTKYLKDRETLKQIKKTTSPSSKQFTASDFDFGDDNQSNMQIVKNIENVESGFYLVVAVHKDEAKRDAFLIKAIEAGQSNIEFFYNVNTGNYYIYYQKFSEIQDATTALEQKGNKPYNGKMVIVKVEK